MIKKIDNCLYCGEKMESKTAKKKFCSPKCRLYFKREKDRGSLIISKVGEEITNLMGTNTSPSFTVTKRKQHNHSLTLTVNPIQDGEPIRGEKESSIDFRLRRAEWYEANKSNSK